MNTPTSPKVRRNLTLMFVPCAALALGSLSLRADISGLREKGPKSANLFSNPGLALETPDVKMAMRNATVNIHLTRGQGDTLIAQCEATFEMENLAKPEADPQDFLVAFPTTGLSAKVVQIENFSVVVDGKKPPTVLRQSIMIGRRETKFFETPVSGQLEARFAIEKSVYKAVGMADRSYYLGAHVWAQRAVPGAKSNVRVSYTATLRPQPTHYTKTYAWHPDEREGIPFEYFQSDGAKGEYYFFDYVLLSGSTWEGPIGHETITLTLDPELKKELSVSLRNPLRVASGHSDPNEVKGHLPFEDYTENEDSITIELKNEEPSYDLLFAIPVSALAEPPTPPRK